MADPVTRAFAVAVAEGSPAALIILDSVADQPQLEPWPHLHIAPADLLARLRRAEDARADREARELEPPSPSEASSASAPANCWDERRVPRNSVQEVR
jgi:predicted RNA polymerase sigma factor